MPSAAAYLPEKRTLTRLRESAKRCRGCDLYKYATQTVFGEGPARARAIFVGEQPGDQEDRQGRPFVGPAGALLRKAMHEAGIDAGTVYITNAVKHFKFVERGKKRIHQKPRAIEIQACAPWLEAEIRRIKPRVVVALGATAAQAFFGSSFRVTQHRREVLACDLAERVVATVHPSSILRAPDDAARRRELRKFVEDLQFVANVLRGAA